MNAKAGASEVHNWPIVPYYIYGNMYGWMDVLDVVGPKQGRTVELFIQRA